MRLQRIALNEKEAKLKESGGFLEADDQQKLDFLKSREEFLDKASGIVKRQASAFASGANPWNYSELKSKIYECSMPMDCDAPVQTLDIGHRNPLIKSLTIDWGSDKVTLNVHDDIIALQDSLSTSYQKDALDKLIYNEIARLGQEADEAITPLKNNFQIDFNHLTNSNALLVMDLGAVAEKQVSQLIHLLKTEWKPEHPDLKGNAFPIWDYKTYKTLSPAKKKLGLLVYSPSQFDEKPIQGFRNNSIYVVSKGVERILQKYRSSPDAPQSKAFIKDFESLITLLRNNDFIGYPGTTYPLSAQYSDDFIFESKDFYQTILKATREDFQVHGTRKYATLEFTNVEQRILALNKIETQMHEDLLKWKDDYSAAQVSLDPNKRFEVPEPTKNALLSNLSLSFAKYFRGDERKILHWGLDLSGGKTVQIELRDTNNKVVTNDADISQAINELYARVNKMGVF